MAVEGDIPVIADFHPSYLRRGKASHQGVFSRILQRAINIASGRDKSFAWGIDPEDSSTWNTPAGKLDYWTRPTLDQCWSVYHYLKDNPGIYIAKDIETSESSSLDEDAREGFSDTEVRLFQLSYQERTGIAIPYVNGFKEVVQKILHLPNPAFGHNWNCFAHDTSVLMADRTWKPIWKIKKGDNVASVNNLGVMGERSVADLMETKDSRPWVEVRVDGAYNRGVGRWGNRGVVCTPEHEWYTSDLRMVRADKLKEGDRVLLPRQGSHKLILGTLLGDASTNRGQLQLSHTNEGWAKAKAENLGVTCKPYKNHGFGLDVIAWKVNSPVPKYWRRWFYKTNGQKNWIAPDSPEALAVFYGDDGCLDSHESATFCLHAFDEIDVERAVRWFRSRYGECKLQNERVLRLWKESSQIFFKEISEYLHPSVAYKLPDQFKGKYNGWMSIAVPQIGQVESVSPFKVKGHASVGKRKFCLSIPGDHRFFTRGGLVSNCFDHKVLRACAARERWEYAPSTRVFDTLDMFHHWQPDLPAHLQFCSSFINFPFPWKHLAATDIELYGICDVDADLQLGKFLMATLKKDGLWGDGDAYSLTTGYTGQEREVRPVLAAMEDQGMPIDDAARRRLGAEFDAAAIEIAEWLMPRFPESAKKLDPYKTFPPELKKLPEEDWGKLFKEPDKWKCKCDRENKMDAFNCGKCGRGQEEYGKLKAGKWYRYGQREVVEESVDAEMNVVKGTAMRWCYIPEFNPNSGKQLIAYMIAKGHKVPKSKEEDADGKQKDTTASKELQRLAVKTADDFYLKVIEYRGLTKLKGTYVDGFAPAADGCVHTTFTFSTAIAQLGARNPNTTNFPKLKPTPKLAKAMRAMVCAPAGKIITEMDWKSCHVITLGLLAGDKNYTRLGRLDIHSAVAGHFLGHWDLKEILKETDEQLMARFKWLKSDPERKRVRDDQAKHGILGIGNGLRAKGLYERYMESFPARPCPACQGSGKVAGVRGLKNCPECKGTCKQSGLAIAEAVLSTCESLFPQVFAYQEAQRQEAHDKQQLRNPFGHMRRFYEVYRWDGKKGCWGHGDQAEEAVAYRLASVAHSHMRELLKELDRTGLAAKYNLFNMIHDSIMLVHDERLAEDVIRDVVPIMTAESKVLPGLWLGVEASQGRRWSEMKEVELPAAREAVLI